MLTLNDGRSELWQWDTGRKISVDVDCSQVHFSNKVFGRSIDVDVIDGIAIIPDILLQTDKELTAWAFVGTPENGYTKISKVFKVNKRNKPADYVFTPTDQTSLEEIIERLDAIEESQDPDAIKNAVEDYLEQNPVEAPVQSVNGKTGGVKLTAEDVGAISQDKLQEATNEALAQAKASGEFDGRDGKDGEDGADGQPGKDGADGEKGDKGDKGDPGEPGQKGEQGEKGDKGDTGATGSPGKDGVNGVTPHIGSNGNWFIGETDTGIPATGPAGGQGLPGAPGEDGKDGSDGKDGTSVTVKSVTESTADGGSNVVTFSDGKALTVKNGSKGSKGDPYTLTDTDKASIVSAVIAALPVYNGEVL